ncbi:hypothetical protein [Chryseobacterium oryctis]|uniref:Uncharacterized protein n=1 Tax=Chryseobacterium oryctis TaxID=2952618 RepID=A0ABT3HIS5_9FLAO|nr:hypothetical protein [Chryseobacterium oryctis]MCW3159677.1 hypothetical protein [Chryseobacterium oryctis]
MKNEKKDEREKTKEAEESAKQKETQLREEKLQKLRDQYMTEELILQVLESYQENFLYTLMKKDLENGKINKFLQVFVDKKLLELYDQ